MKDKVKDGETKVLETDKGAWGRGGRKERWGSQASAGGSITTQTCW